MIARKLWIKKGVSAANHWIAAATCDRIKAGQISGCNADKALTKTTVCVRRQS